MPITTKQLTILLLIELILISIDSIFFNSASAIFLIPALIFFFLYFKTKRTFILLIALIFIVPCFFTMWSIQLIPVFILVYALYIFLTSKQEIIYYADAAKVNATEDQYLNEPFKWRNFTIQRWLSNVQIDLTKTILPNEPLYIHLQQGIGKATIYVPYDVHVELHCQSLYSAVQFLEADKKHLFASKITKSSDIANATRTCIIVATTICSELEVVRR